MTSLTNMYTWPPRGALNSPTYAAGSASLRFIFSGTSVKPPRAGTIFTIGVNHLLTVAQVTT